MYLCINDHYYLRNKKTYKNKFYLVIFNIYLYNYDRNILRNKKTKINIYSNNKFVFGDIKK